MRSSSGSLRNGITGDTLTPTGMPASASARMVRRRRCGDAARGSSLRASFGVERGDRQVHRNASRCGRHRRDQVEVALDQADLVISENGCRVSASTSITERVMRSRRSAGW
jgi:hypothetical protein